MSSRPSRHGVLEVEPELVEWSLRRRGKQKAPTKELVSIRLDKDVVAHFRSGGPGNSGRPGSIAKMAQGERTILRQDCLGY